jgi:hypothetical protein
MKIFERNRKERRVSMRLKQFLVASFIVLSFIIFGDFSSHAADENIPDWLKRVEFSAELETDRRPTFYFQTVQPLYQDDDQNNTLFIQPRISTRRDRTMLNLGVGYRKLTSENLMLGVNFFGDYQDLHQHARVGVGLEALGQILEARINTYFAGITGKRIIANKGDTNTIERVVDGADLEFGAPLPYAPWLKLYGSAFWYDYKVFDNKHGWKTRLEAKINDGLKLEVYTFNDNKGDIAYGGRVRYNIAFHSLFDIKDSFNFSQEPFPEKDLKEEMLIPVERNFDIVVEKYDQTNGLVVEAGRT